LLELRRPLEGIRSYWGSPVELHALACTSDSSEEFWKNPEPCLASWGITRESLIELGTAPPKPTYSGGLIYPQMARISRISGDVRAKLIVDERGEIKWIRPEPGFVLPMFGTQALEFLSRTRFEPALAGGVKHPSDFLMTLRFILH